MIQHNLYGAWGFLIPFTLWVSQADEYGEGGPSAKKIFILLQVKSVERLDGKDEWLEEIFPMFF